MHCAFAEVTQIVQQLVQHKLCCTSCSSKTSNIVTFSINGPELLLQNQIFIVQTVMKTSGTDYILAIKKQIKQN